MKLIIFVICIVQDNVTVTLRYESCMYGFCVLLQGQYDLQISILAAMRLYGMTPVLPGFAGHVPSGFKRVLPNSKFTNSKDWFE